MTATKRYTYLGVFFGLLLPIGSLIFAWFAKSAIGMPTFWTAMVALHQDLPLLYVVETAPVVLGVLAWVAGRQRDRLAESLSLVQATLDATADGILVTDQHAEIVTWNQTFTGMWGIPASTLEHGDKQTGIRMAAEQLVEPAILYEGLQQLAKNPALTQVYDLERRDGTSLQLRAQPRYAGGVLAGRVFSFRDMTVARHAEASIRASEAKLRAVFDNAAVGIVLCDWDGKIIESNGTFQRMLGFTDAELLGKPSCDLSPVEDTASIHIPVRDLRAGAIDHFEVEQRYVRSDGTMLWGHLTVSRLDDGRRTGVIEMLQDITERREIAAQLAHRAFHDPLTELANRARFHERLERALSQAPEMPQQVAVLFVDIDHFKATNDLLGHSVGDELLVAVSARLLNATRGCDTVARFGGDEFAILMENVRNDADAVIVAGRVLTSLQQPFTVTGQQILVSASVGIARAATGETAADVVRNADIAMYAVKGRGGKGHQIFESGMRTRMVERAALETGFRAALERDEFQVLYQPIVEMGTGRVCGAEALVRWRHPKRGVLMPDAFIAFAEESGLIVPLGRWVLQTACQEAARWHVRHPQSPQLTVSVNLSARQLQEESIVRDVRDALAQSGIPPETLTLEITESVIMRDTQRALTALHRLKGLGVRLAIDDFGTGYSSLAYLQQFPIDILKIDKTFVDGVARKESDTALARTIITLAEMLELRCVAEGIEEVGQRRQLERLGCQFGQGYLFARPMPANTLNALLEAGGVGSLPAGSYRTPAYSAPSR